LTQAPDPTLAVAGGPDTHVAPLLPATAPPPEPARKITFFKALLLYWLFPRRYGPHLAAGTWKRALAAHTLSMLVFGAAWLPALFEEMRSTAPYGIREMLARMVLATAARSSATGWNWVPAAITLLCVPVTELALVLLAILIMPWHAGGDRAASVFKRSLKSAYWSTTILMPTALVVFLLLKNPPDVERWFEEHGDLFLSAVLLTLYALPLVLLARMLFVGGTRYVGAPDGPAFAPREPHCDACGYLIIGLPLEARCPECGLEVRASLPGGRRRPTVWQENELRPSGFADLLRLQWRVFRPGDFFKRLPVHSGLASARHFWWGTWCLMLLATLAVLRGLALLPLEDPEKRGGLIELMVPGAIGAMIVPLLLQSLMMFAACLHGQWRYGIRDYRSSAVTCYYSAPLMWPMPGLMILALLPGSWPIYAWLTRNPYLRMLQPSLGINGCGFYQMLVGLASLGVLLFWWLRLGRALRDIQHANV